jgi:serum/glucocorticoid-regulated kinase 2
MHILTLTHAPAKLVELHHKLRDADPQRKLPPLLLDAAAAPALTPKRQSAFLSTLLRLASPAASKIARAARAPSTPTPDRDPFAPLTNGATSHYPGTTVLSGYLTTIANDQMLWTAHPWRRFVGVRTDDLESVRIERAIKRVCSDLAAHVSPKSPEAGGMQVVVKPPAPDKVERLGWGKEDEPGAPSCISCSLPRTARRHARPKKRPRRRPTMR